VKKPTYVWKSAEDMQLYEAYQRIQSKKMEGDLAQYSEILHGAEHADVAFPDYRLSSLIPLGGGQPSIGPSYDKDLVGMSKNFKNVHLSMYDDIGPGQPGLDKMPPERRDVGDTSRANEGLHAALSVRLSDAIVHRLAELDDKDASIRFLWAACRSELLPARFSLETFKRWITEGSASLDLAIKGKAEKEGLGEKESGGKKEGDGGGD
jgi:hypothetical protein